MTIQPATGGGGYQWPPLPILDPEEAALILGERLQAAWDDLEAQRLRVIAAVVASGRPSSTAASYVAEFQTALADFQTRAMGDVDEFLRLHLGPYYEAGAESVGPMTWTLAHTTALTSLARDTYEDFLARSQAAGRTGAAFARAVRAAAGAELPKAAAGGRTALDAAKALENRLTQEYGITGVTYADGTRVTVRSYARMAARTKSAVAYNAGTLNEAHARGVTHMEVFDGPDCGWESHNERPIANGSIRTVAECAAHPVSHPQCTRSFGPRPDVTDATQASATPRGGGTPQPISSEPLQPATRSATTARAATQARRAARTATVDPQVNTIIDSAEQGA